MRKPPRVMQRETEGLELLAELLGLSIPDGYQLFVAKTHRGRCNYKQKTITVPLWAFTLAPRSEKFHKNDPQYTEYYLAHEVAHAITYEQTGEENHQDPFMENFMSICPPEVQHYELDYKPRLAKSAGISRG